MLMSGGARIQAWFSVLPFSTFIQHCCYFHVCIFHMEWSFEDTSISLHLRKNYIRHPDHLVKICLSHAPEYVSKGHMFAFCP